MKINFSFSKLLDDNRFAKIFSVFVAIIAWFIVSITIDTDGERKINDVPIAFNLENTVPSTYGLSIIQGKEQTVDIKIKGKSYKIGNLTSEDFIGIPILSTVTSAGEHEVTVEIKKIDETDSDYSVVERYAKVKVLFDHVNTVTMDLEASAEGVTAKDGFVKEATLVSPSQIILKGPQFELEKVGRCVVESDKKLSSEDTVFVQGKLVFYDKSNNKFVPKYITTDQSEFEITVSIYKHKMVPIKVSFANQPKGLDVSLLKYTLSYQEIEIAGPKEIVDNYKEVTLDPIDFRAIDINSIFELDVNLIAGVVNVDDIQTITVSFDGKNLERKKFNITNISKQNEPAGYSVTIDTKTIKNVDIVGDKNDISKLTSNDLIAVIDLSASQIAEGKMRVPVIIFATGDKFIWPFGEYTVVINVKKVS